MDGHRLADGLSAHLRGVGARLRYLVASERFGLIGALVFSASAWRVFHLAKYAREQPDLPCSICFTEDEWKALLIRHYRHAIRRDDGKPDTQTLWCGLQHLDDITIMYRELTRAGHGPP